VKTIEIGQIDFRYESCRLQDKQRERSLLSSIQEQGILEPLQGSFSGRQFILLDGFKRCRVAKKLGIGALPCMSLAEDEVSAMIQLIRIANSKHLHILEQAHLVDELKNSHGMSVVEMARQLEKSVGWVSMRLGVLSEIPKSIQEEIFSGKFPAYSYLYTLRQFIRMKQAQKSEVEQFVSAVSGKQLSVRNIDLLARGFFQGSAAIREQILKGNVDWGLQQLKAVSSSNDESKVNLNEQEIRLLKDLHIAQKYISRISHEINDARVTCSIYAEGNLLAGGILRQIERCLPLLREFYDRSGQT
jgi:ParB/RepB/Spo0J family partition protein